MKRFGVIQQIIRGALSTATAARMLGLSRRQVFRLKAAVRAKGAQGLDSEALVEIREKVFGIGEAGQEFGQIAWRGAGNRWLSLISLPAQVRLRA